MDEMQAGRELDALIAEKVMGLVWDETHCRICGWKLSATVEQGCVKDSCSLRPPPSRRADEPPHYSTDIAAAWQVVEKISSYSLTVIITNHMAAEGWNVEILGLEEDIGADATTAPEAICLAAQKMAELIMSGEG